MIRIVGVQRSEHAEREFVLLQNQGALRAALKGHVLLSEGALRTSDARLGTHILNDDALIPAGMYVIIFSGHGSPRWGKTRDGAHVFHTYMNRDEPVWSRCELPLHLLHVQHSYTERCADVLVMR